MFDIGSKVVCVDDTFPDSVLNYLRNLPKKGTVYTVRDLIPAQGWDSKETCAVLLVEVANPAPPHRKQWGECGFAANRFAPMDIESGFDYNFNHESQTLTLTP